MSLLIKIVPILELNYCLKKEGNENEGQIVLSIRIDRHDRFVVESKLFFE